MNTERIRKELELVSRWGVLMLLSIVPILAFSVFFMDKMCLIVLLFFTLLCGYLVHFNCKRAKQIMNAKIIVSVDNGDSVFNNFLAWCPTIIVISLGTTSVLSKSNMKFVVLSFTALVAILSLILSFKLNIQYYSYKFEVFSDSIDDIFIFIDHYKGRKLVTLEIKNEKMLKSFIEKAKEKDKWSVMTSDEVSYSFVNSIRQREDFQWLERISNSGNLVLTGLEKIADFEYTSKYLASALCLKETKTLIVTNDADVFSHNLGYEIHSSLVLRVM